ncbi:hypothetical protein ACFTWH_00185 [Streptomyces sp. NPDC057011]
MKRLRASVVAALAIGAVLVGLTAIEVEAPGAVRADSSWNFVPLPVEPTPAASTPAPADSSWN